MSDFPTIKAPNAIDYGVRDPFLEEEFESGDDGARPQFTKSSEDPMTLTWDCMSRADLNALQAHREANRGPSFPWLCPDDGETYNCRYVSNCLRWKPKQDLPGFYTVTLQMKKVL